MRFASRGEAGVRLAGRVGLLRMRDPVVLGIPPGGVPVAYEVARLLGAPLDIVLAGPLDRRLRDGLPSQPLSGRAVVLVDEGISTGLPATAAVEVLRGRGASPIVLATPVAAVSALVPLGDQVDDVVCLERVSSPQAVRRSYRDLRPVSENTVRRLLAVAAGLPPDVACSIELGEDGCRLVGSLAVPVGATGLVIVVRDRDAGRTGRDHRTLATYLGDAGLGTLLVDLLTERESALYVHSLDLRLLADRLVEVTRWATARPELEHLPVGYLATGSAASVALVAAAEANLVGAVVCCGGRPALADDWLPALGTPTLFVVGSRDVKLRHENITASNAVRGEGGLEIVAGATRPFDQPATLDQVADLAASWFVRHLRPVTVGGSTLPRSR